MLRSARILRDGLSDHVKVFSHTTLNERFALYQEAKALPANAAMLEIGSHIGSSALFLCAGASPQGGRLFCVDTWMNETMPDGPSDTFAQFSRNTERYSKNIIPIRKNSHDLQFTDVGCDLDLAFIDGDHSEAAVRGDFFKIAPWIKPGGRIAFHDVSPAFPGVGKVLGEALATGQWRLSRMVDTLGVIIRNKP